MKILHTVEFYAPSVGGMQEAVRQISTRLTKCGHEVTVATSWLPERTLDELDGVQIRSFKISGNYVRGLEGNTSEYEEFLLNSKFDVVVNFAAQQWATDLALPLLPKIAGKKVAVPTGYSGLYDPAYREYFHLMEEWIQHYDASVYLSAQYRDYDFAVKHGARNAVVIPNGAAADEFLSATTIDIRKQLGIPQSDFLILLVGSHTGAKGHREAIQIFRGAHLKSATLLIVGNNPSEGCGPRCVARKDRYNQMPLRWLDRNRIYVSELSRAETVAAYCSSDLFLFPSQIECSPIVIFEAMASKTPFLATKVGNVEELARFGGGETMVGTLDENGYTHANIEPAARQLKALWQNPAKREEMANKGYETWQDRFTWEKAAQDYERLFLSLISDKLKHG